MPGISTVLYVSKLSLSISELAVSYPSYTPMLIRAQELWFHEPAVTTPVLKLFAELAQNRLDVADFHSCRIMYLIKNKRDDFLESHHC